MEGKGREGRRREEGMDGKGREGNVRECMGREGKGMEGKGMEGKGREWKGRDDYRIFVDRLQCCSGVSFSHLDFFGEMAKFSHGYLFFRGPIAIKGRLLIGQGKVHVADAEANRILV